MSETPPTMFSDLTPETPSILEMMPDHKASKESPFKKVFPPREEKVPPRQETPKDKIAEKVVPKTKLDLIGKGLPGVYQMMGATVMMVDPVCGLAIIESADQCAESLMKLAAQNPKVANALLKLMEGGAWGGVAVAHLPIMLAIASHHRPRKREVQQEPVGPAGDATVTNLKFSRPPDQQ